MRTRRQSSCSRATVQDLPGQLLEQVLTHVPFQERIRASAVCDAWRQHLAQPGLPLWQVASIRADRHRPGLDAKLRRFLPLQRWLWGHGGGLLQLQCNSSFYLGGQAETGLLTTFLIALAGAAPSLQALRLDGFAASALIDAGLVGIASMGSSLRQLALVGIQRILDKDLVTALARLPMLQDLAIMFVDERVASNCWDNEEDHLVDNGDKDSDDEVVPYTPPSFMPLLGDIAMCCPALHTLALGHLPCLNQWEHWSDFRSNGMPLPASMSQLTALSSLALLNVGWEFAPAGLPHLPQLRRLCLRGDGSGRSKRETEMWDQLSSFTALEALQVSLPDWPGQVPLGLTQLVVSPLGFWGSQHRSINCTTFVNLCLPQLCSLHHLAFHGLQEVGDKFLPDVCATVAGELPQLISLHLVDCNICDLPEKMFELSSLQLLDLSFNPLLHKVKNRMSGRNLSRAPLHKLISCKQLDLRCGSNPRCFPLHPEALEAIAGMPALEQLALSRTSGREPGAAFREEVAELVENRPPGMPPIRVETEIRESDQWSSVKVELPFLAVNDMLGVQLDRSILPGVFVNHTAPHDLDDDADLDSYYSDSSGSQRD